MGRRGFAGPTTLASKRARDPMLNAGRITREELYEAVWSESVQKLALALGISDVGLAKICKKLNVPRPGRGHWAKSRGFGRY